MKNEFKHVNRISDWYVSEQLEFDKKLIGLRYRSIKKSLTGTHGLELGPAEGSMTQYLVNDFENLTIVEGSSMLLDQIPNYENVTKINSLFEDFNQAKVGPIIMEHILEHVENPIELINKAKTWLSAEGKIIGVPNGDSIHRLAGVKMGLLDDKYFERSRSSAWASKGIYKRKS